MRIMLMTTMEDEPVLVARQTRDGVHRNHFVPAYKGAVSGRQTQEGMERVIAELLSTKAFEQDTASKPGGAN